MQLVYTNNMSIFEFGIAAVLFAGKNDSGYLIDSDQDPSTTNDQDIYEIKRLYMQRAWRMWRSIKARRRCHPATKTVRSANVSVGNLHS